MTAELPTSSEVMRGLNDLRVETRAGFRDVREDIRNGFVDLRAEMRTDIEDERAARMSADAELKRLIDASDRRRAQAVTWGLMGLGTLSAIVLGVLSQVVGS